LLQLYKHLSAFSFEYGIAAACGGRIFQPEQIDGTSADKENIPGLIADKKRIPRRPEQGQYFGVSGGAG
jgi:hypothetical protein